MNPAVWSWRLGATALVLVASVAAVNAWSFFEWVVNPVIHSDSWYFLEAFVGPWTRGEFDWRLLFSKRGADDHAQPLHRLVLFYSLRYGDLDFVWEGRLGLLGLCLGQLLMIGLGWRHLRRQLNQQAALVALIPLALLPLFALSLNSHETFYWSLAMFFHLSLLPALLLMALITSSLVGAPGDDLKPSRLALLCGLVWLVQLALDSAALLLALALLMVLGWAGWRLQRARAALQMAACMLAAMLAFWLASAALLPPVAESNAGGALQILRYFFGHWSEAWRWAALPASASLVHPDHLNVWFGPERASEVQHALALLVLSLHGLFWWSQLRDRAPPALSLFAAVLMLFSYGLVAGILRSRVPVFGVDYLLQVRYVAFYQLANLALLLQLVVVTARSGWPLRPQRLALVGFALVAGAALQLQLSERAWEQGAHIHAYGLNMAENVRCLGEHPELTAPVCQPGNFACNASPEARQRLLRLLVEQRLNVFSPEFVARYELAQIPGQASCVPATE